MVQETRGKIDFSFTAEGTWGKPLAGGTLQLTDAGAYLPTLGIRMEDVSSRWKLRGEQIQVESLAARSGSGRVEGTGAIWLKNWKIERYQGSLTGEKFQIVYRPDLRIQSNPRLSFQGTPQHLTVRGEILIPEAEIYQMSAPGVVRPSSDVILIDQPPEREPPLSLDIQVKIVLGDKIHVKAAGLDTQLAGNLEIGIRGMKPEDMTARGEVRTVGGLFSGYGLSMRIEHGRFIYTSGGVDNPRLDVLALRKSEDVEKLYNVKAGVTILGTLRNPTIKLYSQPALKDEEILSYLFLGRPYDPKQGNLSLLLTGAGGLLAGSTPGPGVLDKLKSGLGIDTVDIQEGTAGKTGTGQTGMGEMQRSLVTIGKYLTPQLYLSYGYSAFTSEQLLKLRYRISKNWEVETKRGHAFGADLYYRIDFY
jgi:translocation and assembly module TamB